MKSAEHAAARGAQASRVLADPAIAEAIELTAKHAVNLFKVARTPEEAWAAHVKYAAVADFCATLKAFAAEGEHAEAILNQRTKRKESTISGDDEFNVIDFERYTQAAARARAEWRASQQDPQDTKEAEK